MTHSTLRHSSLTSPVSHQCMESVDWNNSNIGHHLLSRHWTLTNWCHQHITRAGLTLHTGCSSHFFSHRFITMPSIQIKFLYSIIASKAKFKCSCSKKMFHCQLLYLFPRFYNQFCIYKKQFLVISPWNLFLTVAQLNQIISICQFQKWSENI